MRAAHMSTWVGLSLSACTGPKTVVDDPLAEEAALGGTEEDSTGSAEETEDPADSAEGEQEDVPLADPTVTTEDAGGYEGSPNDWLFSSEEVIPIEITFSDEAAAALSADPYSYVQADITINGEEVPDIGLRLKGKFGSLRYLYQKAAFKVDFNTYVPGQAFYGLKKFNLNNSVVDCSYLKEHIAYKVFRDAGLPAERIGYAWVTVNGQDYGLYNILEQLDDEFLERNYEDDSGNLYDGKYILWDNGSYTLLDLLASVTYLYGLEEGTYNSNVDIGKVVEAIGSTHGTDAFYDTVGELVNWDQVLTYFAAEQFVGQNDGYVLNTNNYFLYFDPSDGKMQMIPWDMDYSVLNDSDWSMNWRSPRGILGITCLADTTCKAAWKARVQALLDALDDEALAAAMADWTALVTPYAEVDPRRECSLANVTYYQGYVADFIADRRAYMTSFWGL